MKFVHIADVHFDVPFATLEMRGLAETRRLEQRNAFKNVIDYIRENNIDYFFICGDLYEAEYVRKSTIEFINRLFESIPNTKIYIVPGNHDPYTKNSYYRSFKFSNNVKVFTSQFEMIDDGNVNIYGYGFEDFYMNGQDVEKIAINDKSKINIFLTHGDLDGAKNNDARYNPIQTSKLRSFNFNYVGLGHIHKRDISENIIYPGSLISLGFDELGEHGMVVGYINEITKSLLIEFIPVDKKEFCEVEFDISDIFSREELIEKINEVNIQSDKYVKFILTGNRNFEIEPFEILKYIQNNNVIKIKNDSKFEVNLKDIAKQNSLKGLFVKSLLEKQENEPENKEKIQKAIEIGLSAFN